MMFLKMAERFPGGRALVFLCPVLIFVVAAMLLNTRDLIQVTNAVNLGLSAAVTYSWRRSILIFLREKEDASSVWLSLGLFSLVFVTVFNIAYSVWIRSTGSTVDTTNSLVVALVKFGYALGFGSLYLVPLARQNLVPPKGWLSLFVVVATSAALSLLLMWVF